jgi:hypothetical protein
MEGGSIDHHEHHHRQPRPVRKKAVRYHWAVYLGTEGADHEVRPRGFFDAFRHNYHGWAVWVGRWALPASGLSALGLSQ